MSIRINMANADDAPVVTRLVMELTAEISMICADHQGVASRQVK